MIDRFDRDGPISLELGTDKDDTVKEMITLSGGLYAFSTKKIFRINTADDIDPECTAHDTRHSYQEIYPVGCGNSFVARSIIQAKRILDNIMLEPGLSESNLLEAMWEATQKLLRCENAYFKIFDETMSLMAECDELIERSKANTSIPSLPQVEELEERVGSFLGSAKRCLEKTHSLLGIFYGCPDFGSKFRSYRDWMRAHCGDSEQVLDLLDQDKDWIRFIAEARNALPINHARQCFLLEVENFKLEPGNRFSSPSWRHDLSDRDGPVQTHWSDIVKDMDIHMHNLLTFLEEIFLLSARNRCNQTLPFKFEVYKKSTEQISEDCPVLYFARAERREA